MKTKPFFVAAIVVSGALSGAFEMADPQQAEAASATLSLRLAQMTDDDDAVDTGTDDDAPSPAKRRSSTPKKATPKKATPKKVVPKRAVPKKAASKRAPQKSPQIAPITAKPSSSGALKVGDAIEVYSSGWYKGRILEIGTGERQGYYNIDLDGYTSFDGWYEAKNVRAIPPPETLGPPRAGKYIILGTSRRPYLPIGYFVLSGGNQYRHYDMKMKTKPGAAGRYRFDAASQTVVWLSGPFKQAKWGGSFQSAFQGKQHHIIINRATVAENVIK